MAKTNSTFEAAVEEVDFVNTDLATIEKEDAHLESENVLIDESTKTELELFPPYVIAYNKLKALFGVDRDLNISELDTATRSCIISSDKNYRKIYAISQALKPEINGLTIVCKYTGEETDYARTIREIFEGNAHLDSVRITTERDTSVKHLITTFKDETVQYAADNRFVPGGYTTTLAENLVKDLFKSQYRRSVYVTKDKRSKIFDVNAFTVPHTGIGLAVNGTNCVTADYTSCAR